MIEAVGVLVRDPELLCVPVGGERVEVSVTLDSSDVMVVEEAIVPGCVPDALDTVGVGAEMLLSVAGGAPGLLASVDGAADEPGGAPGEPEVGGAGGGVLLPVAGGVEASVGVAGGTTGTVDSTSDVEGPELGPEADIGGA